MHFGPAHSSSSGRDLPPSRAAGRIRALTLRTVPRVEALDTRQLFAVASPSVVMMAASTANSQGVTITYDVEAARTTPITLGFFRSTDSTYSTDDVPVEGVVALPAVDSSGVSTTTVGTHTITVPIQGGLPLNPEHPYVLAVANPIVSEAGDVPSTASFRTHTIAVITHGGIQDTAWKKNGPPWTLTMAKSLLAEGYDQVIPWNWVAASNTPGSAAKQGPKLAAKVLALSATFPSTDPVDIQWIGHSEGTVVNTQAIVAVAASPTPQLKAGYWEDTLLDPHAANPDAPGRQYSTSGFFAGIAKAVIDNYQARARDPLAFIPPRVNEAQVFYQQTPAYHDHGENSGLYNLWGQVPVKGASRYFNLTPSGIVHGGNNGVYAWYQYNIVPQLGDGAPLVRQAGLTGSMVGSTTTSNTAAAPGSTTTAKAGTVPVAPTIGAAIPTFTGYAQPGATIAIRIGKPNTNQLRPVASTVAGADGTWTATITQNLSPGNYRVVATSRVTGPVAGKHPVVAYAPLGSLVVNTSYRD